MISDSKAKLGIISDTQEIIWLYIIMIINGA